MKIKEIKIVNQDESTEVADIGADAINVDYNNTTVKAELDKLNTNTNSLINTQTSQETQLVNLQSRINSLASGSPLVASSVAEMTDTTRVYVNTTDGHWYTYNGTAWIDGGVYQSAEDSESVGLLQKIVNQIPTNMGLKNTIKIASANTKTGIYLKEGVTYNIKTDNLAFNCNCYVYGDNSHYIALAETYKKLTPAKSGYLIIYTKVNNVGNEITIDINNGVLKENNNVFSFYNALFSNNCEILKESNYLSNYYIDPYLHYIASSSNVKTYIYEIEKTGNYAILGYGNRLVCSALLDENDTPTELLGKFTDEETGEFKTNILYVSLKEGDRIGVSYWTNKFFEKPFVILSNNDSIINDLKFRINKTKFPEQKSLDVLSKHAFVDGELRESANWRCVVYNCKPNTTYTIKYANNILYQIMKDGTYTKTTVPHEGASDAENYTFTTSENCVQFAINFFHNYNYLLTPISNNLSSDILNDFEQDEKPYFYERLMSNEPAFLFSNLEAVGNKRKITQELYNIYKYPLTPTWGNEYLAPFYKKIYDNSNIVIDCDGDSITQAGHIEQCIRNIFKVGKYNSENLTVTNDGKGGRSTNEWAGTGENYYIEEDETNYPNGLIDVSMSHNPDLLIVGFGMNDAISGGENNTTIEERLTNFENNYREVLERIRGNTAINGRPAYNKSADELSIILCAPSTPYIEERDYNNARLYKNWFIYVREIIKKLCREYKCAFCDFTTVTYDHNYSSIWSTVYPLNGHTSSLHPNWSYGLAYSSILQPLLFPIGLWKNE